jgi:hypothetical protein
MEKYGFNSSEPGKCACEHSSETPTYIKKSQIPSLAGQALISQWRRPDFSENKPTWTYKICLFIITICRYSFWAKLSKFLLFLIKHHHMKVYEGEEV